MEYVSSLIVFLDATTMAILDRSSSVLARQVRIKMKRQLWAPHGPHVRDEFRKMLASCG
jgi:hypothetical protein